MFIFIINKLSLKKRFLKKLSFVYLNFITFNKKFIKIKKFIFFIIKV